MAYQTINCDEPDWQSRLQLNLSQNNEVDLINADFVTHGAYCESLAQSFSMEIRLSRDPNLNVVHFRKPEPDGLERDPAVEV